METIFDNHAPAIRMLVIAGVLAFLLAFGLASKAAFATDHQAGASQAGASHSGASQTRAGASPAAAPHQSGPPGQPLPAGIPGAWTLYFNENFSGRTLDNNVWRAGWFGDGVTGPISSTELACYSSRQAVVAGGALRLQLMARPSECKGTRHPYTGALVSTNPHDGRSGGGFEFSYGALQARIYVPAFGHSIANWPVFITLGQVWPNDGEDDVLEGLAGQACFHFHSTTANNLGGCDPKLTPGWHTFGVDWSHGQVTWYYDGRAVGAVRRGVTSAPMYVVLANTVSATRGGGRAFVADALRVDYVRVWKSLKQP